MNIFERASRAKTRFQSTKGFISAEDLWDLPLTSRTGFDLNTVAKTVNAALREASEEDFVNPAVNTAKTNFDLQLEIVKHVIASKLADKLAAETREKRVEERKRLLAALENKQDEQLRGMSAEEILKKIAEIDNAG